MITVVYEAGEWLPDLPDFANPGVTQAENVFPAAQGYRPWPAPFVLSGAMTATAIGAGAGTSTDEDEHVYAGTATTLERLAIGAWSDVSKVGGYTNTATHWDFTTYGSIMIATNGVDYPQFIDMDVGVKFADATTLFQARTVATVRDFVMFGNTTDATDGHVADRIRWSALGNYTDYVINATTQADFQDNPGGGSCQRIFGGEEAIIFFERAIYKATYVGSPVVFQFDEIVTGRGLYAKKAAAKIDSMVFFLDSDGFYVFEGNRAVPIGDEKVNRWFFDNLDGTSLKNISCAIDHENRVVMWAFPSIDTTSSKPDKIIAFNWTTRRWTYGVVDCDMIFTTLSSTFTLDALDALVTSLDAMNISLDSRLINAAGTINVGVLNLHKLEGFGGAPLTAVMTFNERQGVAGGRSLMTEAWPLVDGGTVKVEVGTRNRQQDPVVWGPALSINGVGFAPLRSEGRYHRVRLTVTGSFTNIQGVQTQVMGTGVR